MKTTNESGRSMVEMLGVLAIIGVLSIGGIAGYTTAMNRYRANEVLDMANKYATVIYSSWQTNKAMNGGTASASWKAADLCKTGLVAATDVKSTGGTITGTECKVNGASIEIQGTPADDGITIKMVFDQPAVCKAAASSIGKTCSSDTTLVNKFTQS